MANSWESLVDSWDPVLRRAFLESIYQLRDAAQIDQIARMLERGDVDAALRAVGLDPVSFRPYDAAIERAFESGGNATAKVIPPVRLDDGARMVVQFDVRNPVAERWLRDHSSTQIKEILDDQRAMIREHLTDGMARGVNPRTAALDLVGRVNQTTGRREGGVIGLTSSQAKWLRNYEQELSSASPAEMAKALTRKLRDKRFDAAVRRAIADEAAIPAELRGKMLRNYKNNALRYRAETIARTEAMASLHGAQEEAMNQAIASGSVDADAVTFVWRTASDKRVRETHRVMDGQEQQRGERFETGSGARLAYPGDPNGPPEEIINCRCFRETKVDFLRGVA